MFKLLAGVGATLLLLELTVLVLCCAGRYREAVGVFLTAAARLFAPEEWAAEAAFQVSQSRADLVTTEIRRLNYSKATLAGIISVVHLPCSRYLTKCISVFHRRM